MNTGICKQTAHFCSALLLGLTLAVPTSAEPNADSGLDPERKTAVLEAISEARDTLARQRSQRSPAQSPEETQPQEDPLDETNLHENSVVETPLAEEIDVLATEIDAQTVETAEHDESSAAPALATAESLHPSSSSDATDTPAADTPAADTPAADTAPDALPSDASPGIDPPSADTRTLHRLRDEPTIEALDAHRIARFQAFVDRLTEEEGALHRLREVGGRIIGPPLEFLPLQPYVLDPRWNQAMALLADDDCDEAMNLATDALGPPSQHLDGEPAIRYAFARIQLCNGNATQGRRTLRELTELDGPVGVLASRALGADVRATSDDNSLPLSTLIQHGRERADQGDVDGALEELRLLREGLHSNVDRHRVRLEEARILEDDHRLDDAAQAYLGVYRMTRWWRSSDQIVAQIEEAEARMDRTIIPFGDRIDRMREFIERGRYRQAQQVSSENVRVRGVSGSEVRGWTRYRQALQNERDRKRTLAATQFEEAESLIQDPEVRPRLYFGWARALRRTDEDARAIELYQRLCQEYPRNHLCSQALFEAGRLLQYKNRHTEAREHFAQLVGLHPFSPDVADALWLFALSAYLEEDFAAAIPPLQELIAHHGELKDESELTVGLKARYWIGQNYLRLGDEANAQRWFQETIDHGALTWYGRLAALRLENAGLPARIRLPTVRLSKDQIEDFATLRLPTHPRLSLAAELARIGLYAEALQEVRNQLAVHPTPEGGVQLRAALHLAMDEPNWAHWIMKGILDEAGPTHRTLRDWGFAFPLNYIELAHAFGSQYGVSPYLVQAIIRQESGFRPTVSSHAGAMGLMQLMPATARYTSRQFLEQGSLSNRQILHEETNVRLGTMYIRIHIAHAADQPSLALAGYNAGPGALRSWFERYGDREIDAFVESITYAETRGYVRKVMTSYITYQGLYGDGTLPHIDLQLPESLRSWGEVPEVNAEATDPVSLAW